MPIVALSINGVGAECKTHSALSCMICYFISCCDSFKFVQFIGTFLLCNYNHASFLLNWLKIYNKKSHPIYQLCTLALCYLSFLSVTVIAHWSFWIHFHVHRPLLIFTCIYVCVCVCVYIYIYICVCVIYIYIYIYMYIFSRCFLCLSLKRPCKMYWSCVYPL